MKLDAAYFDEFVKLFKKEIENKFGHDMTLFRKSIITDIEVSLDYHIVPCHSIIISL